MVDHRRKLVKISGGARGARIIGCGRGQWLGGTMASAGHEPTTGVWGQSPQRGPGGQGAKPPEADSILVIGCPTDPANLAPFLKCGNELSNCRFVGIA